MTELEGGLGAEAGREEVGGDADNLGVQNCRQGFHFPEGPGRQWHPDYQKAILVHPMVYW